MQTPTESTSKQENVSLRTILWRSILIPSAIAVGVLATIIAGGEISGCSKWRHNIPKSLEPFEDSTGTSGYVLEDYSGFRTYWIQNEDGEYVGHIKPDSTYVPYTQYK